MVISEYLKDLEVVAIILAGVTNYFVSLKIVSGFMPTFIEYCFLFQSETYSHYCAIIEHELGPALSSMIHLISMFLHSVLKYRVSYVHMNYIECFSVVVFLFFYI